MIICILTDVALWPPEYSKCVFFHTWKKRIVSENVAGKSLIFWKEKKRFAFFWWKRLPQQKKYKHALCKPPTLLSINLSICLSIFYFISVSLDLSNFLSIDLLWFIFLHTVYQRFLLVLGFFPTITVLQKGSNFYLSKTTLPSNSPSLVITCILAHVTLWPRNILSAVLFTHGRKILYKETLPDSLSWKKKHFVMLSNENGSHDKRSINTTRGVKATYYLSIYLFVFLSVVLLWFIYLHPNHQDRFKHLEKASTHGVKATYYLSIYLFVFLSVVLLWFIYLHPNHQDHFRHLDRNSRHN